VEGKERDRGREGEGRRGEGKERKGVGKRREREGDERGWKGRGGRKESRNTFPSIPAYAPAYVIRIR